MLEPEDIPWPRILAEGVAIVSSILLAFGIEAWYSQRQITLQVSENLAALRVELRQNIEEIELEIAFRSALISSAERLLALSSNIEESSETELDRLISDLSWGGTIDVSTGALSNILQSGLLSSIEDGELQRSLAGLPGLYEKAALSEVRSSEFTNNRYVFFVNQNSSLSQIFNTAEALGRPGGAGDLANDFRYPVSSKRDHSALLKSEEFMGYVALSRGFQLGVIVYYERLMATIQKTIELIDEQVQ